MGDANNIQFPETPKRQLIEECWVVGILKGFLIFVVESNLNYIPG